MGVAAGGIAEVGDEAGIDDDDDDCPIDVMLLLPLLSFSL